MTIASDKLASIREPTLTLDLDVDESGQERHVSVELTNDELKNLISSLEAANKVIHEYHHHYLHHSLHAKWLICVGSPKRFP